MTVSDAYTRDRQDDCDHSLACIDNALAYFEEQDCEPDHAQRVDLADAIGSHRCGLYGLSAACANRAFVAANERSPLNRPVTDPVYNLTLHQMREAYRQSELEGVKLFRTILTILKPASVRT